MRKTLCAMLGVAALSIAMPVAAQPNPDRGIEREYRDRDRDQGRNGASQAELNTADSSLTRIYQRRVAEARAADRAAGRRDRSHDWYGQEASLRAAERQWIAYRDADCRYASQQDQGRTWYRNTLRQCLVERTEERTTVLREGRMDVSSR
jgi:uncharacterized protein YecT (DUF1311 family)